MIDYSKLSDAELEAIANDDYKKLSNKTLQLLANEPEKTAVEKFKEPFKDVSIKDWSEKSLLAPMLQTMKMVTPFGMLRPELAAQDLKKGSQNLIGKGAQMAQGAYQVATNPVESAQRAYTAVTENPAGVAGELVKGALYDPEMLIGSGLGNVAERGLMASGRAAASGAKTASNVAEGAVNTLGRRGTKPGERATYAGQYESARQPAGLSYNLPENLQAWRDVNIDTAELNRRAMPYTAEQTAALKRTGGMVPYSGQVARATGEALAEPYTRLSGYIPDIALGIGGTLLGVGPFAGPALNLARKGVGLYNAGKTAGSMRQLGDLGFKPLYPEEINAINKGLPHPSAIGTPPAAGPVRPPTPQAMAAQQINPAMATTPAAQAALATTQAKAQTIPPTRQLGYTPPRAPTMYVAPEGIAGTNLPQVEKAALQQRYAPQPVAQPVAQSASLFETPLTTPEVTAAPKPLQVKATEGKTAEQIASEQKLLDLINQKAGRTTTPDVINNPAEARKNFLTTVEKGIPDLIAQREQNKISFGKNIENANDNAGKGFLPNPKDDITQNTVVRHMINQIGQGAVRQSNKIITVNKQLYNDLAADAGFALDWNTAPKITDMKIGDARATINKWMFDNIDKNVPELGLKKRRPSQAALQRQADKEMPAGTPFTASEEAALTDRMAKLSNLTKSQGGRGSMGLMTEPLEMITNKPSAAKKIDDVAWSTPEEFDNQVFMNTMGKGADKEFIAKGIFPEGKIIRAIDKKTDSEAVQYNNGDGFMIRKTPKSTESQYSILNKDGTMYEINKTKDSITRVEIRKNNKIIAEYNASPNKQGSWWVAEDTPDGGSMMVSKNDLGISKNPNTKKLHQQLPKINFSDILNEQLTKLQSLKEGK